MAGERLLAAFRAIPAHGAALVHADGEGAPGRPVERGFFAAHPARRARLVQIAGERAAGAVGEAARDREPGQLRPDPSLAYPVPPGGSLQAEGLPLPEPEVQDEAPGRQLRQPALLAVLDGIELLPCILPSLSETTTAKPSKVR